MASAYNLKYRYFCEKREIYRFFLIFKINCIAQNEGVV